MVPMPTCFMELDIQMRYPLGQERQVVNLGEDTEIPLPFLEYIHPAYPLLVILHLSRGPFNTECRAEA